MKIDKSKALARATELHQSVLSDRPMAEAVMHLCQVVAELEQMSDYWMEKYECEAQHNAKAGR